MSVLEAVRSRSATSAAPVIVTAIALIIAVMLAAALNWAVGGEGVMTLGMIVLVALSPVFIRWPVVSTFGVYALLLPFDALGVEGMSLTRPVAMLAAAMILASGLVQRRLIRPPRAALWWGIFVLWAVLSATWALHPDATWRRVPTAISLFVLYVASVSFKPTRRELHSVCMLAVIGGAIAAVFAYMYGFDDSVARGAATAAARGKLVVGDQASNPNGLAEALMMPLTLAIGAFLGSRGILQRATAMAFLLMIGLGVYISMSRSGIVALAAVVGVFFYRFRANRQVVIQILMVVAVLVALTATMPSQFYDRIAIVFSGEDPTGSGRTEIWQVAIEAIKRFGLFGAGLENFVDVHQLYVPHGPRGYGYGAHNSYLMVWVELGIVGLVLMLSAMYCHLRATAKLKRRDRTIVTLEAASMAVVVVALFGDIIWTKLFWWPWILTTWAIQSVDAATDETERLSVPTHKPTRITVRRERLNRVSEG